MAISVIGTVTAATTSLTPTTHAIGDYIIIVAMRSAATAPTLPAGFTNITTGSGNSNSYRIGYKVATSTTDASGTWTNASLLICTVYRGVSGIGAVIGATKAAATTATIGALTIMNPNSNSWVCAFAGHAATSTQGTPLAGATTVRGTITSGTYNAGLFDTNAGVNSFSATTSSNTTSVVSSGGAFELIAAASISTFSDQFNQTTLNTTNWLQFLAGSATMTYGTTGAQVNYPASSTASTDGDLTSNLMYSLIGAAAYVKVLSIPSIITNADAVMWLRFDANNFLRWVVEAGTLYAQYSVAGVTTTPFSVTYSATTHLWWRIRESGGNTLWDTSADNVTWTNQGSVANTTHGLQLGAMYAGMAGVCYEAETSPGTFKWIDFNTAGATTTALTLALKYTVIKTPSALTKSLKYTVKNSGTAITKSAKYTIKTATALTKSLKYTVLKGLPLTRSAKYTVKTTPTGANIVTNGDFETGSSWPVTGWQTNAATPVLDNTVAFHGTQSVKMVVDSSNTLIGIRTVVAGGYTVLPNTTYALKLWVKSDTAGELQLQLADANATKNYLQTDGVTWNTTATYQNVATTTTWTMYTLIFTTYPGQSVVYIQDIKRSSNSTQANRTFWVDYVSIGTLAGVTKPLRYAIAKATAITKSLKYTVLKGVPITKTLKYTIKTTPTAATKALKYTIIKSIALTKTAKYTVKTTPAALTKALKYEIKTVTSITKALKYTVKKSPAITKTLQYNTPATVTDITKALKYTVRVSRSATKSLKYTVVKAAAAALTKSQKYTVIKSLSVSKSLKYTIKRSLSVSKALKYTTKTSPTALTKALKYTVRRTNAVTKSLKYTTTGHTAITKSVKYTIKTTQNVTKSLKYTVKKSLPITKTLKYTVKTSILVTKSAKYTVKRTLSLTKSTKYTIARPATAITKGVKYTVKAAKVLTLGTRYEVRTSSAITKAVRYAIANTYRRTLDLTYVIGLKPVRSKPLPADQRHSGIYLDNDTNRVAAKQNNRNLRLNGNREDVVPVEQKSKSIMLQ